ncbi:MAG: phosphoribosylglycinamide formyltransferase [Gammaproteobacteria bacterium]|nr:MAG: phosphoribosylglycinamide formyltransferase [Gammaproteobacteria bacterium]
MESLVILISGRGSNMQALLEAKLPVERIAVISNNANASGLEIARQHGIETIVLDHRAFPDRQSFDVALAEKIDACQPKLIALAGFMRILSDRFVQRYQGRLMNIHPSLLPAFPGLGTHARALQEGIKIHGCTVHFVTMQLDHGPIVIQAAIPVLPGDTEETLAARVLAQEHRIYPQAVRWFMEDRIRLSGNQIEVIGSSVSDAALYSPGLAE